MYWDWHHWALPRHLQNVVFNFRGKSYSLAGIVNGWLNTIPTPVGLNNTMDSGPLMIPFAAGVVGVVGSIGYGIKESVVSGWNAIFGD